MECLPCGGGGSAATKRPCSCARLGSAPPHRFPSGPLFLDGPTRKVATKHRRLSWSKLFIFNHLAAARASSTSGQFVVRAFHHLLCKKRAVAAAAAAAAPAKGSSFLFVSIGPLPTKERLQKSASLAGTQSGGGHGASQTNGGENERN